MSGVEVAGLVLGALPVLLAGLQFYAEGIAVTKRYRKFGEEIEGLIDDLKGEHAVYQNSIETLLIGIVEPKDVARFLADPGGALWKAASFDCKLRKRLGTSQDPYLTTVLKLRNTVEEFTRRLSLAELSQPQFAQPQTFKAHYKRLRFSLYKGDYADLMDTVRNANTVLHRLTFQRQNIENQQRSDRVAIPDFKIINERAHGFFSILSSSWTCPCQSNHAVNLRLELRTEAISNDEEDEEEPPMRDPFHVLFQYEHRRAADSGLSTKPWTWDEADIHVVREDNNPSNTATECGVRGGKGVRFASQAKKAVKALMEPEPNPQPIKDLCSEIRTLQCPQRHVCLTILEKEIARQKYGLKIIPSKILPQNTEQWSVFTLRSALKRGRRFSNRDRVRLAVILASSVLQLHETPWLDDNWGIDNIYFVERPGPTAYHQPYVSRAVGSNSNCPAEAIPKYLRRMIQNQPLFALGVALIELWYGQSLLELHDAEDGPHDPIDLQGNFITRLNTAYRMGDEIANDAGAKYSDAIRRCLRCDFNERTNSFDDIKFQKAVFHGVVAQLKDSYDFMG